jgi:hypothetical protein
MLWLSMLLLSLLCGLLMLLFLAIRPGVTFYCLVAAVVIFVVIDLLPAGIVTVVPVDFVSRAAAAVFALWPAHAFVSCYTSWCGIYCFY